MSNSQATEPLRQDGRTADELRPVSLERNFIEPAEGSVLISLGGTRVICTASIEEKVPPFLIEQGATQGWVTAEYGMLPRSTGVRTAREAARGHQGGRTVEIQRLIGRSMRAVTDLEALGPRTIRLDCDVIQADGGTRTAAITGAFVALHDACTWLKETEVINQFPIRSFCAAVSIGIVNEQILLDLNYNEDVAAAVDMNLVMAEEGRFVEIQGGGEKSTFSREDSEEMIRLGRKGIFELIVLQYETLGKKPPGLIQA